jgi:hypothetical protein
VIGPSVLERDRTEYRYPLFLIPLCSVVLSTQLRAVLAACSARFAAVNCEEPSKARSDAPSDMSGNRTGKVATSAADDGAGPALSEISAALPVSSFGA